MLLKFLITVPKYKGIELFLFHEKRSKLFKTEYNYYVIIYNVIISRIFIIFHNFFFFSAKLTHMFNIYFSNLREICLIKLHTIKLILAVLKSLQECNKNIFTCRLTLFVRIIKQNNPIRVLIIFNSKREKPSAINRHFYYLL